MSDTNNPWREFIENCISGNNYFRASEYMDLLADLDRGYAAEAEIESLRSRLANLRLEITHSSNTCAGQQRRAEIAEARLAEAERFIEEIRDESAEDWRTHKYVVVQITEETWDKLKGWKATDSAPAAELSGCSTCDGSGYVYRNDLIWLCRECNTGASDQPSSSGDDAHG